MVLDPNGGVPVEGIVVGDGQVLADEDAVAGGGGVEGRIVQDQLERLLAAYLYLVDFPYRIPAILSDSSVRANERTRELIQRNGISADVWLLVWSPASLRS